MLPSTPESLPLPRSRDEDGEVFVGIADGARAGHAAGKAEDFGPWAQFFARRALEITTAA